MRKCRESARSACAAITKVVTDERTRQAAFHHGVRLALIVVMVCIPSLLPEKVASFVVATLAVYSDQVIAFVSML